MTSSVTASSSGLTRSKTSSLAPTMSAAVPASARLTPPPIGASQKSICRADSASMISRSVVGVPVVVSMTTDPGCRSSASLPSPTSRSSTSAGRGSDRKTYWHVAAISSSEEKVAPLSTRRSATAGLRSLTCSS